MPKASSQQMNNLKNAIEKALEVNDQTNNAIASLINTKLESMGNGTISPPTLNRIWSETGDQSRETKTFDLLVSLLTHPDGGNWTNWDSYRKYQDKILSGTPMDAVYRSVDIDISKLDEGETFTLGTPPSQYSVLKYLGDYRFEVLDSVNMHKKKGTVFSTVGFSLKGNPGCTPHIMLDDYDDGYFDYHKELEGPSSELWEAEYYYL